MYDKLGELLSDAIESGNFFSNQNDTERNKNEKATEQSENNKGSIKKYTPKAQIVENKSSDPLNSIKCVHNCIHINNHSKDCIVVTNQKLIKYAPLDVKNACTSVSISEDMDYDEAKKQYHKKLMRFHPDRNADNEVMRKITKEKTIQIMEAWKIIEAWFLEK